MNISDKHIILASKSPRRKNLISYLNIDFSIIEPNIDETLSEKNPVKFVCNISKNKAESVYNRIKLVSDIIISADTVVSYAGDIFGKPRDKKEAYDMLSLLSNRTHQVYTGVSIIAVKNDTIVKRTFVEKTDVSFCDISPNEIKNYIATGEPMDKAGAYGIQGMFSIYVKSINGDYNNVVGLPVCRLYNELLKL